MKFEDFHYICHRDELEFKRTDDGKYILVLVEGSILAVLNSDSHIHIDLRSEQFLSELEDLKEKGIINPYKVSEFELSPAQEIKEENYNIIIKCPHCNTEYKCTDGGCGTHCYDYKTIDGKQIVGILETGILECPDCGKEFKDNAR